MRTVQRQKRSISDSAFQSVLCLKLNDRQTMHLQICSWSSPCLVLASEAPATDGQVVSDDTGRPCNAAAIAGEAVRRNHSHRVCSCLMGLSVENFLELTTWDKFERGLVRWRNMVVSDSFGCWDLQHKERATLALALEDTKCPVIVLARTLEAAGWAPLTGELVHNPDDAAKQFSLVGFSSRRATDLGARSASHAFERLRHISQVFAQG